MDEDHSLNVDLIRYNQLLMEAHNQFQMKDIPEAVHSYESALQTNEAINNPEKQSLIKSNLGVIYFHNCEYKKSLSYLQEAYELIRDIHNEFRQALIIKLLGNLCIVNLINNKYEQSKECNEQALEIIQHTPDLQEKRQLFEELIFIYFRFTSFEAMGDGNYENIEQKYDGPTLGCFYSAMGINRELCNDPNLAFKYHKKALDVWNQCKQNGFIVITLRRLITLGQQITISQMEMREFVTLLQKYMQTDELKGLSAEILFKDCEKKIQCAREITISLKYFEENMHQNPFVPHRSTSNLNEEALWKLALRLRLKRAVNLTKELMEVSDDKDILTQSIQQLQYTISSLSQQQPQIVENQLMNQPFTKESINHLKAQINRIRKSAFKGLCVPFFQHFKHQKDHEKVMQLQFQEQQNQQKTQFQPAQSIVTNYQNQPSFSEVVVQQPFLIGSQQKLTSLRSPNLSKSQSNRRILSKVSDKPISFQVLNSAYRVALLGDYLIKCNKNTNGRIQRFFKLGQDNTFRWASKDKYINDPNKIQYYQVSDIRGLIFGKCTDVLNKPYNKQIESWLCFSLVMRTRSMDFYCEPDQVNPWVIALSDEIKRRNKTAYVLRPGLFFWRKLKMILQWFFVTWSPQRKKDKRFKLSYTRTVIAFGRNGYSLPRIEI